jgi:ABC-2 type transport system ATP-binding protein
MASQPVIGIESLVKHYGDVEALRGISLEVHESEVFGFLGPNGAGKTTTIRCLLGLLTPTSGRITCFGLDASRDGVALRARLAYVPGELRFPERVTGAEVAATIGRIRGNGNLRRRAALADRFSLDLGRPIRELSTGNRRKLALVLAFESDAQLLVLDEPTSGLDPLMQRQFLDLVREEIADGRTVFMSSHVLSEVQRAADRIAVLRAGQLIALSTVDALRSRARQRVEIWFEGEVPTAELSSVAGLADAHVDGQRFNATLSGPVQPLIELLGHHPVKSMLVEEPDLEEAFVELYEEQRR